MSADRPKESFAVKYIQTAIAASVAETVTFPLDITKTRLQAQGERVHGAPQVARRGMLRTMAGIAHEEGFRRLWFGLSPAILRHVVYSGCRMSFYEYAREHVFKRNADGSFPLYKGVVAGMMTGAAAQLVANPTDLVKVQMQMEGRRLLAGEQPRFQGTLDAFLSIVRKSGYAALWKGAVPNMQRAALVNLGDLTTYDQAKQLFLTRTTVIFGDNVDNLTDGPLTHGLSSLLAGLVAATMGTPADVIKTRVMNNPDRYASSLQCLRDTVGHHHSQAEAFLTCI